MALAVLGATLVGFFMGVGGTAAGGLFLLSFRRPSARTQALLLGCSAGIMLMVVFLDLFPEAVKAGGWTLCLLGTFMGLFLVQTIDQALPKLPGIRKRGLSRYSHAGLLLGLGIALHNFPEGVALGTVYAASRDISGWLGIALLMSLHNIPEGMVMAAAMRLGRVRLSRVLWSLVLVEIPMALGAMAGGIFGELSAAATGISLGFAGGAMLYITIDELVPAASETAGPLWMLAGLTGGSAIGWGLIRLV